MSSGKSIDITIQKLAKHLSDGNRKNSMSVIRSRLSKPFENETIERVWKGWERALNRQETNALIFQLLNGIETSEVKKIYQDMKKKKKELLVRDHAQIDLSKNYIATWVSLLEIYCNICQDK